MGSKNFTEQIVLGEIAAQQIERRLGVRVERRLNLGGTLLAHEALKGGGIDLYPEYTGTALTAILHHPPVPDPATVLTIVRAGYAGWNLVWLPPLGFNDTFAMVIRGEESRRQGIATLSQAALRSTGWQLGVGYEFARRPDGLAGLLKTYGLKLFGAPRTMDLGLLYRALQEKQVDMVAGNTTDGFLARGDVTVLADDRRYFPPYQAAFVVRRGTLDAFPPLQGALTQLSGRLDEKSMRRLNELVDGEHVPAARVAADFLDSALGSPATKASR